VAVHDVEVKPGGSGGGDLGGALGQAGVLAGEEGGGEDDGMNGSGHGGSTVEKGGAEGQGRAAKAGAGKRTGGSGADGVWVSVSDLPMSLPEKRQALLDDLITLPDAEERFVYLLDKAKKWRPLDPALKTDERLLPGCVSRLWLYPRFQDGRCWFEMEADAMISKGIAAVLCGFYSGETPADIVATEPDFLAEAGLTQVLSANRSNALANLRRRIKAYAEACLAGAVASAG
jgi:cysteine desulfuration protein SufE